jgi:hypothetical protein
MRPLPAGELMPEKTIETTYSFEKTVDGGGKMTVEANCQYYCVPKPNSSFFLRFEFMLVQNNL